MGISTAKKKSVGARWIMGGDFNDIRKNEEKIGGMRRQENSFRCFRDFILEMEMGDIRFKGNISTWANNREGEGFIQKRLDSFFGSKEWMIYCPNAEAKHILRQSSDHSLLILDTTPKRAKTKSRFIFNSKWTQMQGIEELLKDTWEQPVHGTRQYQVQQKLKRCKQKLLTWRKVNKGNAKEHIEII